MPSREGLKQIALRVLHDRRAAFTALLSDDRTEAVLRNEAKATPRTSFLAAEEAAGASSVAGTRAVQQHASRRRGRSSAGKTPRAPLKSNRLRTNKARTATTRVALCARRRYLVMKTAALSAVSFIVLAAICMPQSEARANHDEAPRRRKVLTTPSPSPAPIEFDAYSFVELKSAIAQAATSGASIIVMLQSDVTAGQTLVIESQVALLSRSGAMISGGGSTRLIRITSNGRLGVENITLREGYSQKGGGAVRTFGGSVELKNGYLTANSARWGGAVYIEEGSTTLNGCSLAANSAEWGGAVFIDSGMARFNGCAFASNIARADSEAGGGAICNEYGGVELSECTLTGNSAITDSSGGWA